MGTRAGDGTSGAGRTHRRAGRGVLAAAALAALAGAALCCAAPAMAEVTPEVGRCVKVAKGTGAYGNSACTKVKPKGNSYEWEPGAVKTGFSFTSTKASLPLFEDEKGSEGILVKCTGTAGGGHFEGAGGVSGVSLRLTGCKETGLPGDCSSAGAAAGEIVLAELEGEFAASNPMGKAAAVELHPAGGAHTYASFTCDGTTITLSGSFVGPGIVVNHMKAFTKMHFNFNDSPLEYQTEEAMGELSEPEEIGLSIVGMKLIYEEELEIDAAI